MWFTIRVLLSGRCPSQLGIMYEICSLKVDLLGLGSLLLELPKVLLAVVSGVRALDKRAHIRLLYKIRHEIQYSGLWARTAYVLALVIDVDFSLLFLSSASLAVLGSVCHLRRIQ